MFLIKLILVIVGWSRFGFLGGLGGYFLGILLESLLTPMFRSDNSGQTNQQQNNYYRSGTYSRTYTYDDFYKFFYGSAGANGNAGAGYNPQAAQVNLAAAYSTLGISSSASDDEVKSAYRRMAMQNHPDKVATESAEKQKAAETKFRKIQDAYETIKKHRGLA